MNIALRVRGDLSASIRLLLAIAAALLLPTQARAQAQRITVDSPSGVLQVAIASDGAAATWSIARNGRPVIEPSRLGFMLRGGGKFERGLRLENERRAKADARWEQPWGESRWVVDRHNELRVTLAEQIGSKRRVDLVVRAFDDGVGFRYEFPDQPQLRDVIIDDELTEFVVARPGTAWWTPAGEWNRYEYITNETPIAEVGTAHTPITMRTEDGLHLAIHEAALVDYAGMWLRKVEGRRFRAQLSPASEGWKVRRTAPFATPWRTVQIAASAPELYRSSDLILNLNAPNRLGDTSWFRPHKYLGIWWTMHLGHTTIHEGPRHAATTANAKRYIDFAARHGFPALLIEGWNKGFEGNWIGDNGRNIRFTTPASDYDIDAVTAYARRKGVRIVGHHENGGNAGRYEAALPEALDYMAAHGIGEIKTGYVADAGGILRSPPGAPPVWEHHDGQFMTRHHLHVVAEAAKRRIAVNAHEPVKDTGLRRTYPNWVSREGARGMEHNAWNNPKNTPRHEVDLVFTRMLAGPMDFTPGILSLEGVGRSRIASTLAKQLALYVVLYSPVQMVADLPEHLDAHPRAFAFLKQVPVDWAETRLLNGEVGRYVTFARADRNSADWYLGAVTDGEARRVGAPLSFLPKGKRYRATIYRDGPGGGWQGDAFAMTVEQRVVTSTDTIDLPMAPGGGAVARLTPLR